MGKIRFGLLPRILVAIVLAVVTASFYPVWLMKLLNTFSGLFSQYLGFLIPFIIIAFVTKAISDMGKSAGRLLLLTVGIAYLSTILSGLLSYGVGLAIFPSIITPGAAIDGAAAGTAFAPYFSITIPPVCEVMTALIISFVAGLGMIAVKSQVLKTAVDELASIIEITIKATIIPVLPFYIFAVFSNLIASGDNMALLLSFLKAILVVIGVTLVVLLLQFSIAGIATKRNPFKLLWTMAPAYFTALGTSSSAATIPVTLQQVEKLGVPSRIAGFSVPLCATIHMSGSSVKLTGVALALMMATGMEFTTGQFIAYVMLIGVSCVAGPGVPGGAVMSALWVMQDILGFSADMQALMIGLYVAIDSFGTACNVTGDGAIALILNRLDRQS